MTACKAAAPEAPAAPAPAAPAAAPATAAAAAPAASTAASAAPAVQLPAEACAKSEDGFASFLEQFVYEAPVRAAYSAPTVEVRDIKDPSKVLSSEAPGPFRIALVDSQWSYNEPGKDAGQFARIKMDRTLSGDRMRVDFVKAEFSPDEEVTKTLGKPEAYVFEFKQGCWQLTQQLR
ncbi:hypothetical protein ASD86_16830 [Lysobacter sp. Root690]|nr:hypothetical protein ASD86_16830 [Lysobacter sp. Root690]